MDVKPPVYDAEMMEVTAGPSWDPAARTFVLDHLPHRSLRQEVLEGLEQRGLSVLDKHLVFTINATHGTRRVMLDD